jgi:hypothetical protein
MLPQDFANLAQPPQAKHDVYMSAAARSLSGAPQVVADQIGKTPEAKSVTEVMVPDAPLVASRTSPGTVPMKTH